MTTTDPWISAGTAIEYSVDQDPNLIEYHPRINGTFHAKIKKDQNGPYKLILPAPWSANIRQIVDSLDFAIKSTNSNNVLYAKNTQFPSSLFKSRTLISWTIKQVTINFSETSRMEGFIDIIEWSEIKDGSGKTIKPSVTTDWVWRRPKVGETPPF